MYNMNNDKNKILPIHPNIIKFRENFVYIKTLLKDVIKDDKADVIEQYLNASRIESSCYIPENMVRVVLKNRSDILRIWMLSGNPIFCDITMKNIAVSKKGNIMLDEDEIYTEEGEINKEKVQGFVTGRVYTETIFYDNIAYIFQTIDIPDNTKKSDDTTSSEVLNE